MSQQDNFLNNLAPQTATPMQEVATNKTVHPPAVVALNNIQLDDLVAQAEALDVWFNSCGGTSLKELNSGGAPIPMTANVFAVLGSVIDLITVLQYPQQDADLDKQQVAYLTINLLGLIPQGTAIATALMALRPLLAEVASKKFGAPDQPLDQGLYLKLQQHLNDKVAGDLEKFLKKAKTQLGGFISASASLATALATDLQLRITSAGLPVLSELNGTLSAISAVSGQGEIIRDPEQKFSSWTGVLNQLIRVEKNRADAQAKLPVSPEGLAFFKEIANLSSKIMAQSATTPFTVAWLLDDLINNFKTINSLSETVVGVPVSHVGEHKAKVAGGTLEFMSLQPQAVNNPACACPNTQTENHITYAMGTEKVEHQDFIVYGKYPLQLVRSYQSQCYWLDDSEFGARWSTPFTKALITQEDRLLYIHETGRQKRYPLLEIGDRIADHEFGTVITRVSAQLFTIEYGTQVLESYELIAEHYYALAMVAYVDEGLTLGLRYDQKRPIKTKALKQAKLGLSHLLLRKGEQLLLKIEAKYQGRYIHQLVNTTDADQPQVLAQYQHDQYGNLSQAIDEYGHQRQYEYNGQYHQLQRYTDRTGRGQHIRYENTSAQARAVEEWRDDGSLRTRLVWDEQIRKVTVYDAHNVPTSYYYDLDGMTYRTVYADGLEEWAERNADGQIIKQIHRDGTQTLSHYNAQGQPEQIIRAHQAITHMQYNEDGLLIATRDSEGGVWRRDYNEQGQLITTQDPLGRKTQLQYASNGLVNTVQDAKGGKKQIEYNALGQMAQFTDCSGKSTQWQYDERGRLLQVTDALGNSTQHQYANEGINKGQLSQITFADGKIESYEYDAEGRLLAVGDGKQVITRYRYNQAGLISSRETRNNRLSYQWDLCGRLSKLINANGAEFVFTYDKLGRLSIEKGFDGVERRFEYAADTGRLLRIQTGNTCNEFHYDVLGQVSQRTFKDADGQIIDAVKFRYNSKGQLLSASNPHSQIEYFYDLAGQMTREHQHYQMDGEHFIAIWQYQYDALGNLETTIRPDGQQVSHLIYGSGHVYGIALNQQEIIGFERDDLHREIKRYYGNGLALDSQFDKMGRVVSQQLTHDKITQTPHLAYQQALQQPFTGQRAYQYNQEGLLSTIQDQRRGVLRYDYDELGRLIGATSHENEERFAFDPAGNIIDPLTGQQKKDVQHSADAPQAMQSEIEVSAQLRQVMDDLVKDYMGAKYHYDKHGNVTDRYLNKQHLKLTWNALNQLQSSEVDGIRTDYIYDVFGRRIAKRSHFVHASFEVNQSIDLKQQQAGLEQQGKLGLTLFGWQGEQLAWESYLGYRNSVLHTGLTAKTTHYIYEPDTVIPVAQVSYGSAMRLLPSPDYALLIEQGYDRDKDPVWTHDPIQARPIINSVAYYHCDHLGTPQEMTDQEGELLWSAHYKAWGEAKVNRSERAKHLRIDNYHRYQGQYFDAETGLHYNRFRYYDPHLARYISRDPIGLNGGMNLNAYVPNPNQWIDPLGLNETPKGRIIGSGEYSEPPTEIPQNTGPTTVLLDPQREKAKQDQLNRRQQEIIEQNLWKEEKAAQRQQIAKSYNDYNNSAQQWNKEARKQQVLYDADQSPKVEEVTFLGSFTQDLLSGEVRDNIYRYGAGLASTVTLGGSNIVARKLGVPENILDKEHVSNKTGQVAGLVGTAISGVGSIRAAGGIGATVKGAGILSSTGAAVKAAILGAGGVNCGCILQFDYLVCSTGAVGFGSSQAINLHNGQVWDAYSGSPSDIAKNIAKVQNYKNELSIMDKLGKKEVKPSYKASSMNAIKNIAGQFSGGCMVGYIVNKNGKHEEATDNFLGGLALNHTRGGIIKYGTTVPLSQQNLKTDKVYGLEFGVSPNSNGTSMSYGTKGNEFTAFELVDSIRK